MSEHGALYEVTKCTRGEEVDEVILTSRNGDKKYRLYFEANNSQQVLEVHDISTGRKKAVHKRSHAQYLTELAQAYLKRNPAPAYL